MVIQHKILEAFRRLVEHRGSRNSSVWKPNQQVIIEGLESRQLCSATVSVPIPVASPLADLQGTFGHLPPAGWPAEGIVRLDNPVTGDHLITKDSNEFAVLTSSGRWVSEGAPFSEEWTQNVLSGPNGYVGLPLYRLYNSAIQKHLFTTDANEESVLTHTGWALEEIACYVLHPSPSGQASGSSFQVAPLYRLYNSASGAHLITDDPNEYNVLTRESNWISEGVEGYVLNTP